MTYGSGDYDTFSYDTNTGRMTQFKYTVSSQSEVGNLGWNKNGSLGSVGITDPCVLGTHIPLLSHSRVNAGADS